MASPSTGAKSFLMMALEQQIAGSQVGGPLTTDGPNWGLQQFPIDPGAILARVDDQVVPAELTGFSGSPQSMPGRISYPIDLSMGMRTGPLVPIMATCLGKPTVSQDGAAAAYNYAFSISDATADAVSLWGLFHKGGSTYPIAFARARFGDLSFETDGNGLVTVKAKGMACLDTEHGIGDADAGNTGGFARMPVIMGDRSDANRLTDILYVKVADAPAAGVMQVQTKLGSGSYSTAKSPVDYSTATGLQTSWAELFDDVGPLGFNECENRSQILAFFPGKLAGFVTDPATAPTGALVSPAAAGNIENGVHKYKYTFVNATGETLPSAASADVTVADKAVNGQVLVSGIAVGEVGTVARKVYRTEAAGSTYKLLTTISNNTATTFLDNVADASLTTAAPVANDAAVDPAVGDLWVFPALCQIPGTAAQGGDTTVARTSLTGCRFGPAHVAIRKGDSSADTLVDFDSGSVKMTRTLTPAYTHGPGARNPYDVDVVGYITLEIEMDRRFDSREFERRIRTNDRYVVEVLYQGAVITGSASAWREEVKLSIPQARVDKVASPLTGPGITKEKLTIVVEQKADGSPAVTAAIRSATDWNF